MRVPVRPQFAVQFIAFLVAANGAYILASSLVEQIAGHRAAMLSDLAVDLPLLIGLSLVYLGALLRRRKRTAWVVTIMAYIFYLGTGLNQLLVRITLDEATFQEIVRNLVLPLAVLALLFLYEKQFIVKSDIQGFRLPPRSGC